MRVQTEAQQPLLQACVSDQLRHRTVVDDGTIVDDDDVVAERRGGVEILLDEEDRLAGLLQRPEASIMLRTITGARPLVGSSTRSSRRGSTMARAMASICF